MSSGQPKHTAPPVPLFIPEDPKQMARLDALTEMRVLCAAGKWREGVSRLQQITGGAERYDKEEQAQEHVRRHFEQLLADENYLEAGTIAYHRGMFDPRPRHVRRIFHTLTHYDLVMLVGSGDLGKSLNAAIFASLFWIQDPDFTLVKFASVTDTNLKQNLWAKLLRYQDSCLFPVGHEQNDSRMRIWKFGAKDRPEAGIDAVLVGRGEEASGRMKGNHPQPFRNVEHPRWGWLTRILLLLDEGQHLPKGVEQDLGSPMTSVDPETHVMKIVITANLTDELKWAVKKAAPRVGWREELMDTLYDWTTDAGWRVCRVDTQQTENIVQRREVFPGFPKFGGEKKFMNGTVPTSDYYIMWRGWTVPGRSAEVVIPSQWFEQALGEPIFVGRVQPIAAFDPAYDQDTAVLALGRYGQARGWLDWQGNEMLFDARTGPANDKEHRHTCVLDQLIHLKSRDPVALAREVKEWCVKWNVGPEYVAGDRTGNGIATTSHLQSYWGHIAAINWRDAPTEHRILAEHKESAGIYCDSLISEMYFTIRCWIPMNVRGFFINPLCDHQDRLKSEFTTRLWKHDHSNRFSVEQKVNYIKRGYASPGFADATVMMGLIPRLRGLQLPALNDEKVTTKWRERQQRQQRTADQTSEVRPKLAGTEQWHRPLLNAGNEVVLPADFRPRLR